MKIIKAYKTRIYPTSEQEERIKKTMDCCRYIYNHMLARNQKIYERRKEHLTYNQMQNLLPEMKNYQPWLREADSQALKYACRQLDDAYKRFFQKQGNFPRFKKKRGRKSYTTTNIRQMEWMPGKVKVPCLGYVKTRDNRVLPAEYKFCRTTISQEPDGRYYVSMSFEYDETIPEKPVTEERTIGLDYNVSCLYVDDKGNCNPFPHWYQDSLKKLALEQRKLSRMQGSKKGEKKSHRYLKQLKKINRLHAKVSRQRQDYLQKVSTLITKAYTTVCIEDLSVKEMQEAVKKLKRRDRKRIDRAYANNGWYSFTQMLCYKENYSGGRVVKIGKYSKSSQTCHTCGCVNPDVKDLKVRKWVCPQCGTVHDRDKNAARNIKAEGLKMLQSA